MCKWCLVRVLLLVVRLFPLISRDCLSNLCMLRAGICFVAVSSLLCLYYLGAWPLTYMICSAPKKKSYIWLLWEYLFLYPSFSQWCPLLRCICICFWRSYSFTSHGPTQNCFLLGMSDSLCLFTLEPFNAGHPCTEAWFSMKTCISVTCSYFWYFFLCFSFFVPVCIWFPVYSTESLFLALCHFFLFLSLTK